MTPPVKHFLQFSDLNASEYAYLSERACAHRGLRAVTPASGRPPWPAFL
jgi:hypothetical protein